MIHENIGHWVDIAFVGFSAAYGVCVICKDWYVIWKIAIYASLIAAIVKLALP